MDVELIELAAAVGEALTRRQWMLCTAESCTGGWIATCVTAISGSSAWFDRGLVTYSNAAKTELLGVAPTLLASAGAVSAACVAAMASGALEHSRADVSVAVSGIAGPGGGSTEKPVGTVYLAWARRGVTPTSAAFHFSGDRTAVRRQAVVEAMRGVIALCAAKTA